jgi:foldase protein PrsA
VRQKLLTILALGAFFVAAVAFAGCGGSSDSVPSDSVAKVGDTSITKKQFDHWLAIAAKGNAQSPTGGATTVPDPPSYKNCIAAKRKTTPQTKNGPKQTDSQLKAQCASEYKSLRDQTMNFLIQADWVFGEAKAQDVKITNAEVQKQFKQTKQQAFPKESDFKKFLKTSGMSMNDILYRVKLDAISNKLRAKVIKGKSKVTDAQVQAYYAKHKSQFGTPERRDLLIVLTKDKGQADQALKALKSGQKFKAVAKKYSIDQQTKNNGGLLSGVVKGQQDADLDKAAFAAPKGKLEGPVKAQFGYYVFQVKSISKATEQSLAQSKATIKQTLQSQNQTKALNSFVSSFRKRWTKKTNCLKTYAVTGCKNAPKPKKSKTATTTTGG